MIPLLTVSTWAGIPGLAHGFCSRIGGVSQGDCAGLNLSRRVGDDETAVQENWRRVGETIGDGVTIATARQVHGCRVVEMGRGGSEEPEADALVAATSGIAVGVLTADCVPLLLVAPEQHVAAAVHAGWRGTLAGVAAHSLRFLEERFHVPASAVSAALGPAIGACCYEVDAPIGDRLRRDWGPMPGDAMRVSTDRQDKIFLDLRQVNRRILVQAGVDPTKIVLLGPCTRCAEEAYFSHRGATMRAQPASTGRQLSFVGWRK